MPYGQNEGEKCFSIDIYALRAKEKTIFKEFLSYFQKIYSFRAFIEDQVNDA